MINAACSIHVCFPVNAQSLCIFRRSAISTSPTIPICLQEQRQGVLLSHRKNRQKQAGKLPLFLRVIQYHQQARCIDSYYFESEKCSRTMVLRPSIPAIENPTQDKGVSAMRAVNAALQDLTSVVNSGWKAPPAVHGCWARSIWLSSLCKNGVGRSARITTRRLRLRC